VAIGLRGAVAAQPDLEARRGVAALRTEGEPALPTGVPMTGLDDGTWRWPATEGERQWHVGQGGRQREATGGAALLSPSCGVASSTTAQHLPGDAQSGRACVRRGEGGVGNAIASSDSAVRAGRLGLRGRKHLNGTAHVRARARGSHAETAH
jgi:hypothetical protein